MTAKMTAPTSSLDTVTKLRRTNLMPVAVGSFKVDAAGSRIDDSITTHGGAKVAARFVVTHGATVACAPEMSAEATLEFSLIGAAAISVAAQKNEGLYRTLVGNLVIDAGFRVAIATKKMM